MTFDFSFDLSVLDQADKIDESTSAAERTCLALLKLFLHHDENPQLVQWQSLQQRLVEEFLPYIALIDVDSWAIYQEQLQVAMFDLKQQFIHHDYTPKHHIQLEHSPSLGVWQELLQAIGFGEPLMHTETVQQVATLCASLPVQMGYAEVLNIGVLNCFDTKIELQISDLLQMMMMHDGTNDAKMDLSQLVRLQIRVPSWLWPEVILQCGAGNGSSISLADLKKQLDASDLKPKLDPSIDLEALFDVAQHIGQQKIQQTRQLLSSLTHVLLDEDALGKQAQQAAEELQKTVRQQVTALQNNVEQLGKFCELFKADLQKTLPYYTKNHRALENRKNELTVLLSTDNKELKIFENLKVAAEQGDVNSQFNLGQIYEAGRGVAKDHQQAARWYWKAAEQGYTDAQFNLGQMYEAGRGVAKNNQQAAHWYSKAAEQGDANAQFNLGQMYEEGRGVVQNGQKAIDFYRKAAEQNHMEASTSLCNILSKVWHDASTNLTWMRCSLGQTWDGTTCVGTAKKYTWDQAKKAIAEMNRNGGYAGYTDWVLPDIDALKSLLRLDESGSKIDQKIFPNTPAYFYWSASPLASYDNGAWLVYFGYGGTGSNGKNSNYYVRAVRTGQ